MLEMTLVRIVIQESGDEQVIVLKEKEGQRAFPIVIGIAEAVSIDRNVKNIRTPRPMTHNLIENILTGVDARLEKVEVTELREGTFYARLTVKLGEKAVAIDSRPSDAIALATLLHVPIFVDESVLDAVGAE